MKNHRPIIAKLSIAQNITFNENILLDINFNNMIHEIIHILGFQKQYFKKKNLLNRFSRIYFYSLNNINEKNNNLWFPLRLKFPQSDLKIKNEIMSEMSADRSLNFSSETLSILQRLNWYQINLSLCGLSLKRRL